MSPPEMLGWSEGTAQNFAKEIEGDSGRSFDETKLSEQCPEDKCHKCSKERGVPKTRVKLELDSYVNMDPKRIFSILIRCLSFGPLSSQSSKERIPATARIRDIRKCNGCIFD
jgi:hypothetical protein